MASITIKKNDISKCIQSFTTAILSDNSISSMTDASFNGQLGKSLIRPTAWKIFLKIYPQEANLTDWITDTISKRAQYKQKVKKFLTAKKFAGDPLGGVQQQQEQQQPKEGKDTTWNSFFQENEMKKLINLDLDRTYQELDVFHNGKIKAYLASVLFIWSKENSDISYKQGLNELLAVFFLAFYPFYFNNSSKTTKETLIKYTEDEKAIEEHGKELYLFFHDEDELPADLYFIFECMMTKGIRDMFDTTQYNEMKQISRKNYLLFTDQYTKSEMQEDAPTPLNKRCTYIVQDKLKALDPELFAHFMDINLNCSIFLQRWLKCIFNREFEIDEVYLLWDAIFANEEKNEQYSFMFIDFIAIAMILKIRTFLIEGDQNDCFMQLFKYPPVDSIIEIVKLGEKVKISIQKKLEGKSVSLKEILGDAYVSQKNVNPAENVIFNPLGFNEAINGYNVIDKKIPQKSQQPKHQIQHPQQQPQQQDQQSQYYPQQQQESKKNMLKNVFNSVGGFFKDLKNEGTKKEVSTVTEKKVPISNSIEAVDRLEKLYSKLQKKLSLEEKEEMLYIISYFQADTS